MASLFDHLLETMPLAAAAHAMLWNAKTIANIDVSLAHSFLRFLKPGESYQAMTPPLRSTATPETQELWAFSHDACDPATITDIWCRVNNAGFASQKVLERLEWGFEDLDSADFKKVVRITTTDGAVIDLPLTLDFVDTRLVVYDGVLPEDATDLWKLEMRLDKGLVIALVYEIDADNNVTAWRKRPPKDANEQAGWVSYDDALNDIASDAPRDCETEVTTDDPAAHDESAPLDAPSTITITTTCKGPWGGRIGTAELMPASSAQATVSGAVPSTAPATVSHMKVLVVLSLSTCRERSDYEPGGVVGMARIYPHIMVKADVPLRKIEATVRYDRPEKTTRKDPPDGLPDAPMSCCSGRYDVAHDEINAILVADANDNVQLPIPLLPFWGNMFNYYRPDAFQTLGATPIKVVCTDRHDTREDDTGLVERDIVVNMVANPVLTVKKMPHQGEFDNLHMAPKLQLVHVTHVRIDDKMLPVDRAVLCLDEIAMAPFCAHDCFHMHWRWGAGATSKWAIGWDETGPHKVPGAPLVPLNQDVYLRLRSQYQASVHHVIGRDDGSVDPLPPLQWQVVKYQGAAYAVEMTGMISKMTVDLAYELWAAPPTFYEFPDGAQPSKFEAHQGWEGGKNIFIGNSNAMFYWHCRWTAQVADDDSVVLVERLRTDDARLFKARSL
jgi:hypothetical protein